MKFVLCNAFSINMLPAGGHDLAFRPIGARAVKNLLVNERWESAIGHADTAAVVSGILGGAIPANRTSVELNHDTSLSVAQYSGPRLPEGATTLPDGAKIDFWQVYHAV